jgi:hypothetical protein
VLAHARRRAAQRQDEKLKAVAAFRTAWRVVGGPDRASFAVDLGTPVVEVAAYLDRLEREFQAAASDQEALSGLLVLTASLVPPPDRTLMWLELDRLSAESLPKQPEPWLRRQAMFAWFVILLLFIWISSRARTTAGSQTVRPGEQTVPAWDPPGLPRYQKS